MKRSRKALLLGSLAVLAALAIGTGVAMAQQGEAPSGATDDAVFRPGMGPMGPDGPGRGRHLMGGEVIKVEGNTITIKTLKGEEKAVKVDDNTKYRKPPDGAATLADVKAGEKVGVLLDRSSTADNLLARAVMIGEPPARGSAVIGEITKVDGNKVTIKAADGSEKEVELPAISQGNRLGVMLGPDGAVRGVMYDPPERPADAPDDGAPAPDPGQGA